MQQKPVYVLGTGLSHDGATCILKDGELLFAIEKERLTRKKHDGGNDKLTVQYCLDAAGITVDDLSLVVQAANFEKETIAKHKYLGERFFKADCDVPFVSISHHLAHAYSAIGTCPFNDFNILIIDGCGSRYLQCDDLDGAYIPDQLDGAPLEKDSFYRYTGNALQPLYKDFSAFSIGGDTLRMPTTQHSIGGLYSMASNYVFGNMDDVGKLMGLAPYGKRNVIKEKIFRLEGGRVFVNDTLQHLLNRPAGNYEGFKKDFNYYADIAAWVQQEVEEAVIYLVKQRNEYAPHPNLCYAGGVALNAVANARIIRETGIKNLYMTPAAADNGLAIGCAYYGWLEVLKQERRIHNGSTYLGKPYSDTAIHENIKQFIADHPKKNVAYKALGADVFNYTATHLANGKVIGWYQDGAEFGPRALGNRSILADGRKKGVRAFINRDVKFREDFRPFAPAVMAEDVNQYFCYGYESPYMILVDQVKDEYKIAHEDIVHVDGSARVQTVTAQTNAKFYSLLDKFKALTGSSILLNTSLNRKGMPIVETPYEALALFYETALDMMVIGNYVFEKA